MPQECKSNVLIWKELIFTYEVKLGAESKVGLYIGVLVFSLFCN